MGAVPKNLLETQPTDIQIKPDFKISSYTTSGSIQNLENLEEITESTISRDIPMFLSWGGNDGKKFIDKTLAASGLEEPCASYPDFCDNCQFHVIYCVSSCFCTLFQRISD